MTNEWVTQQLRNRARTLTQVSLWVPWPMGLASPQAKTLAILWKDKSLVLDGLETLGEQPLYTNLGWKCLPRAWQRMCKIWEVWPQVDWRPRGGRPSGHQEKKDHLRPWLLPWEWRAGSMTSDLGQSSWPSLPPLRYRRTGGCEYRPGGRYSGKSPYGAWHMSSLDNNSRNTHSPLTSPAVSYGRSPRLTALSAAPGQLPSVGLSLASGPGVSSDPSSFVSQTAVIIHVPEPWSHCYPSQLTWKLAVWARVSGDLGPLDRPRDTEHL